MTGNRRFDRFSTAMLALVLGFMFWFVRNDTERPIGSRELRPDGGYDISFEGAPPGADPFLVDSADVVLTVRGILDRLDQVSPTDIEPYVDVADLEPEDAPAMRPISWRWRDGTSWGARRFQGVRVERAEPASVMVDYDPIITATRSVSLAAPGGPDAGLVVEDDRISPAEVLLQGPSRRIAQIQRVVARVPDVSARLTASPPADQQRITVEEVPIEPIDSRGTPVPDVTPVPAVVDVAAVFRPGGVRLPVLVPPPVGEVADGYWLTGRQIEPREVTVYGPPQAIDELVTAGVVNTVAPDITGITQTRKVRVPLQLGEGLRAVGLPGEEVTVTLQVEALPGRREMAVDVVVADLPADGIASVSPQRVLVALSGPKPTLEILAATDISARVEIGELGAGTHRVPVDVRLPAGEGIRVEEISPETVEVILRLPDERTELPSNDPTPVRRSNPPTPRP